MSVRTPHDRLVRWAFRSPVRAAAFLSAFLPEEIGGAMDLRTLRVVPGSFIDPVLRESITDLLFETRAFDRKALISLLFEHKSSPDHWVALTTDRYIRRVWDQRRELDPDHPTLPLVIPIVLHHGFGPWPGPRDIRDLLDLPEGLDPAFEDWLPAQRILFIDLSVIPDEVLRSSALGTADLMLVLLFLKHSRSPDFEARLQEWGDLLVAVRSAPNGWIAFARLVRYIFLVREDLSATSVATTFGRIAGPRAEESVMTIASRLKAEGKAEGRKQELRERLLRVLLLRFGPPVAEVSDRIASADPALLETWFDRAVIATDPASIFE